MTDPIMDTANIVTTMYICKRSLSLVLVSSFSNNGLENVKSLLLTEFIIYNSFIIIDNYNNYNNKFL